MIEFDRQFMFAVLAALLIIVFIVFRRSLRAANLMMVGTLRVLTTTQIGTHQSLVQGWRWGNRAV